MANTYVITSTPSSVIFEINGRAATYNREGELRAITTSLTGDKVSVYDEKLLLEPKYRVAFDLVIGADSINVNGETVFANAKELIDVLQRVFFSKDTPILGSKSGRNSDIDPNTDPQDVWDGGGLYKGFNCTQAETLEFFSSDAQDVGILLSSGVATGGSKTTLIDSSATFITDGVVAGDLVIDDTQQIHGVIASVDSETQLTVFDFSNGVAGEESVAVGDSYRVASSNGTGAAVCKFSRMLDADYNSFSEYVIMNGLTPVDSVGTYLRNSSGRVVLAGTSQSNVGNITGRQKTTTANVTVYIPIDSGQSSMCVDTVPKGEMWEIYRYYIAMARLNGLDGSAKTKFQTRKRGEAWQTKAFPEVSNASIYVNERGSEEAGGLLCTQFTDIRWHIESVSDIDSVVSADFDYRITKSLI